jgi:hypothetical protein
MYSDREKFDNESVLHDPVRVDCARRVEVNKGVRQSPEYDSETRAEPISVVTFPLTTYPE